MAESPPGEGTTKTLLRFVAQILLNWAVAACGGIPINLNIPKIETSHEIDLSPDLLARIDAVNRTLESGMEVGPETRQVIRELNETLRQGMKAGFDEATLERVDDLLRVVEDGVKIGLDQETLDSLNGMVETIDRMPGNWEVAANEIIRTLERSGGTLAGRMADEVKGVMAEARLNMQQMTAVAGIEFRCNVDFLGSKAGATLQEFIGHSIVGKLRRILSGESPADPVPIPWVCQVIPDQIELVEMGGKLLFPQGVITLTSYNYVDANSPRAYLVDEAGHPLPGVQLFPYRSSPYQIQLNLQGLDFSAVPPRSRIVFEWPNVPEKTGIALLMPVVDRPVAAFTFTPASGDAPLTVQFTDTSTGDPTEWHWSFGDGATSNERNPIHTFVEARRYEVQLTVANPLGESSVSQILVVGEGLAADFTFNPRQGEAPLIVEFSDRSAGNPTAWEWDFGDGERSNEQNPSHVYMLPNPAGYTVTLRVSRGSQSDAKSSPDRIIVNEKLDADFTFTPAGGMVPLTVSFRDTSKGSNIAAWLWEFGDGTTSTERNPIHTYAADKLYDVTLTVTTVDGQSDREVKRGVINAYAYKDWASLPVFRFIPIRNLFQNVSVYHPPRLFLEGGQHLDTEISYDQYVCGVFGLSAGDGDIEEHDKGDILKAYLYRDYSPALKKQTWWLTADFRTHRKNERWQVDIWCFDRATEGIVFEYREFTGLEGGKKHNTGLLTRDYSFCGIVGQAALYGDINEYHVQPVLWEAYMDGSGPEWQVVVDFITHGSHEERWNVNVLCLKRDSYPPLEKPMFKFETYSAVSPPQHRISTTISSSDYLCGVAGVKAEWGDVNEHGSVDPILHTFTSMGAGVPVWMVFVDVATEGREENWTVNVLCVDREFVKREP